MKTNEQRALQNLFQDQERSMALFDLVRVFVESLGHVTMKVSKTQVSFATKRQFVWVWLPQAWIKKRQRNTITISFSLGRRVQHKRIEEAVEPYPGRWMHHVLINGEEDLDENVWQWLKEAHRFSLE